MKYLLLIALLCICCGAGPSKSTRVYNSSGKHVLTISPKGAIRSNSGASLGRISKSGKIYSASGSLVGTVKGAKASTKK